MKIIVLAGGISPEREVSLSSAAQIAKALIASGNAVAILDLCEDVDLDHIVFENDFQTIQEYKISREVPISDTCRKAIGAHVIDACKLADLVYIALHGDVGENGKIQAVLEMNGVHFTGSSHDGCSIAMDKVVSKRMAESVGVKTPEWSVNRRGNIDFPCVVKPSNGGSSIGVAMVNNDAELDNAIHNAKKYDNQVLIEKRIIGREFSVGILNDTALPVIEIMPKNGFYDYENKYQAGNTVEICPADISPALSEKMRETACLLHKTLKLKYYSRIDFLVDEREELYFLEANALPGMTPTSLLPQEALAVGIDYKTLCKKIAMYALANHHQ